MGYASLDRRPRRNLASATPLVPLVVLVAASLAGCGWHGSSADDTERVMIRVEGSDTMVNVAQAWAEQYHRQRPDAIVQVLGGGSGVGIASLIDGNCDMANSSRMMKQEEMDKTQASRGDAAVAARGGVRRHGHLCASVESHLEHFAAGAGGDLWREPFDHAMVAARA